MKLKYYLRGIGIGVIVATLVMTVSSVIHNNNLSDETIIKEAQKLGMVMPDSTEDNNSLWVSNTETPDTETLDTETSDTENLNTESSESGTSNTESVVPEDSQAVVDENMAEITIVKGDAARQVSEKLFAAGLVDSVEEFHAYLSETGYAYYIYIGTYQIPKGSTFEEICDIIVNK